MEDAALRSRPVQLTLKLIYLALRYKRGSDR